MRVQVCTLLYKKILRLNSQGAAKTSVGKLINLMSNDAARYEHFLIFFPQGLFMPVSVGATMWYLYIKVGSAIFATLGTVLFICVCSVSAGFKMGSVRNQIAKESDSRLRSQFEWFNQWLYILYVQLLPNNWWPVKVLIIRKINNVGYFLCTTLIR